MHVTLTTPNGFTCINVVKTNSIELVLNKINVSFTSEKTPDIVVIYKDVIEARLAYKNFMTDLAHRSS